MVEALRRRDRVELRGFGAFSVKIREARQGRNPRTGVVVAVAKKAIPAFKTGKEMRARLNRETEPPAELERHSSTLTNKGRVSPCPRQRSRLHLSKKKGTGTMAGPPQSKAR
jgi:hypothetical protein